MDFVEKLFIGGGVAEPEAALYCLRRKIPMPRLYCIVFFADRQRLEILSSKALFHPRNKNRPAKLAGIAMGRAEALELVAFMAQTACDEGKNPAKPQEWIE